MRGYTKLEYVSVLANGLFSTPILIREVHPNVENGVLYYQNQVLRAYLWL